MAENWAKVGWGIADARARRVLDLEAALADAVKALREAEALNRSIVYHATQLRRAAKCPCRHSQG